MKNKLSLIIFLTAILSTNFVFANSNFDNHIKVAEMVKNNWDDNYIENIKFNIGNNIMSVNGTQKPIDTDDRIVPAVYDGRTMLPARIIAEELGAKIDFDSKLQEVKLELDDINMILKIGEKIIDVNGEKKEIDTAPIIENGRTMLPVRAITDNLGMNLEWNEERKEITLTNDMQMKRIIVQATEKMSFDIYEPTDKIDMGNYLYVLQFDTLGNTKRAYDELSKLENIEYVELDTLVTIESDSDVNAYEYDSWGVDRMHVNEYVSHLLKNNKNDEVVVAVLDTGITKEHSIFENRIKEDGYNFWDSSWDLTDVHSSSHGTHVAGIIADLTRGTNVKLLPMKIAGTGESSSLVLTSAINYAIDKNVDVINISFTMSGNISVCNYAINRAIENGIVVVNASGNDCKEISSSGYKEIENVILVGAIDEYDKIAGFSNYGSAIDVVAPGVKIYSTLKDGYGYKSGTSMAAPHISAVAALYKLADKDLTPSDIEALLKKNVDDLGEVGVDIYYGSGIPNMAKGLVKKIEWNFEEIKLKSGEVMAPELLVTYSDGVEEVIKEGIQLETANQSIVSVKNNIVTANNAGETYIKASYLGVSNTNNLKIIVETIANNEEVDEKDLCPYCLEKIEYVSTDTIHVLRCEKDKSHIVEIADHTLDSNNKCTVCGKQANLKIGLNFVDFKKNTTYAYDWAYNNVASLVSRGIVNGTTVNGQKYLYPDMNITPEAVVALMSRSLGYEVGTTIQGSRAEYIPGNRWSRNEWNYLMEQLGASYEKDIRNFLGTNDSDVVGVTPEILKENYSKPITRGKVAYLMSKFLPYNEGLAEKNKREFTDLNSNVTKGVIDSVNKLASYGILRGHEGKVRPNDNITRAEAIAMFDRFIAIREAQK